MGQGIYDARGPSDQNCELTQRRHRRAYQRARIKRGQFLMSFPVVAGLLCIASSVAFSQQKVDIAPVTEKHEMVPMSDGVKLSVYLYFPEGKGPWPVLYEQRYSDVTVASSRKNYAALAMKGYVVAAQNFRGAHLSEGVWIGYRALGWGEHRDGYDTVAWLAKQPWSTGKIGTFGGSQAGY